MEEINSDDKQINRWIDRVRHRKKDSNLTKLDNYGIKCLLNEALNVDYRSVDRETS